MARIFIINDSEELGAFLKIVFEDHGHNVTCYLSPRGIVQKAAEEHPDIILVDINLPHISGIKLTSLLKKDGRTKNIYIIVCSATNYFHKDIEEAINAGGNDFMSLPCAPIVALTRINLGLVNTKLLKENIKIRQELDFQKELFNNLLDNTPDIVYFKDRKGKLLLVNKAHAEGHGKSMTQIIGKTDFDLFPLREAEVMTMDDMFVMETRKPIIDRIEYTTRPSGEKMYVSTTKIPRFDEENNVIGVMGITRNITSRIMAEKDAFREKAFVSNIINASSIPTFVVDRNRRVIYWNKACEKLTGIRKREVLGTTNQCDFFCKKTSKPCLADLFIDGKIEEIYSQYEKVEIIDFLPESIAVEYWVDNLAGKKRYLRVTINFLKNGDDEVTGLVQTIEDLTLYKENEISLTESRERLSELALKDSLTGLYNYRYLIERLGAEFKRVQRSALSLSLVMLDIDFFKSINDAYGHRFGDYVIKNMGDFVRSFCRENDIAVRFGGEEFVVLLPDTDKKGCREFTERLEKAVQKKTFKDRKRSVKVSVSFGAASYPDASIRSESDLLRAVDSAMRKAKERGGNCIEIFSEKKNADLLDKKTEQNIKDLQAKVHSMGERMERSVVEFLFAFAKSLEGEKYYAPHHVEKMEKIVGKMGKRMKLEHSAIEHLRQASALYDIGKICIDDKILMKKGRLNAREYEKVKMHPAVSAQIIREVEKFRGAVPAVLYHHERYDGKGYASGLKGKQIPLSARILSVADAFDALTSPRPYRSAYSCEQALKIIQEESGLKYDPEIVDILKKIS